MHSSYQYSYSKLDAEFNKYNAKIIIDYYKSINKHDIDIPRPNNSYGNPENYGNGNPECYIPSSSGSNWVPIIHMPTRLY